MEDASCDLDRAIEGFEKRQKAVCRVQAIMVS